MSLINITSFNTYKNIEKRSHLTTLYLKKLKPRKFIKQPGNFYIPFKIQNYMDFFLKGPNIFKHRGDGILASCVGKVLLTIVIVIFANLKIYYYYIAL